MIPGIRRTRFRNTIGEDKMPKRKTPAARGLTVGALRGVQSWEEPSCQLGNLTELS